MVSRRSTREAECQRDIAVSLTPHCHTLSKRYPGSLESSKNRLQLAAQVSTSFGSQPPTTICSSAHVNDAGISSAGLVVTGLVAASVSADVAMPWSSWDATDAASTATAERAKRDMANQVTMFAFPAAAQRFDFENAPPLKNGMSKIMTGRTLAAVLAKDTRLTS